jgi:hypothetical protein
MEKPKNANIKAPPKGIAKFPNLHAPDTKFNPEGTYSARLVCTPEEAAPVLALLNQVADEMFAYTKADMEKQLAAEKDGAKKGKLKKAIADLKKADLPVKPVYDEEGNETGDVELNFKMNAQRLDRKTQDIIKMRPKFFDAKGKEMSPVPVWGGSTLRCSGQVVPFYTAAVGVGATLRLSAVQVLNLVSGGTRDAAGYGFAAEDGYSAAEQDAPLGGEPDEDDDGPPSNDDF